jgi:hypothetical protein
MLDYIGHRLQLIPLSKLILYCATADQVTDIPCIVQACSDGVLKRDVTHVGLYWTQITADPTKQIHSVLCHC